MSFCRVVFAMLLMLPMSGCGQVGLDEEGNREAHARIERILGPDEGRTGDSEATPEEFAQYAVEQAEQGPFRGE